MFFITDGMLKAIQSKPDLVAAKSYAKLLAEAKRNFVYFVCDASGNILAGYYRQVTPNSNTKMLLCEQ